MLWCLFVCDVLLLPKDFPHGDNKVVLYCIIRVLFTLVPKDHINVSGQDGEHQHWLLTKDEITGLQTSSPDSVTDVIKRAELLHNVVHIRRPE